MWRNQRVLQLSLNGLKERVATLAWKQVYRKCSYEAPCYSFLTLTVIQDKVRPFSAQYGTGDFVSKYRTIPFFFKGRLATLDQLASPCQTSYHFHVRPATISMSDQLPSPCRPATISMSDQLPSPCQTSYHLHVRPATISMSDQLPSPCQTS